MDAADAKRTFVGRIRNIRLLPPKDSRFYEQFDELAKTLLEASEELITLFATPVPDRRVVEERIHSCNVRCKRINDSIEELLQIAQQPPFDRSEISELVENCLKTMKYIKHAANRYVIYNFPSSDKEMRELAPLIRDACREIQAAFKSLPRHRNLAAHCDAVDRYETLADNVYHEGLSRRFSEIRQDRLSVEKLINDLEETTGEQCDPLPMLSIDKQTVEYVRHVAVFFILRQVYAEMERAIDACTEVTGTLRRMVTKNV